MQMFFFAGSIHCAIDRSAAFRIKLQILYRVYVYRVCYFGLEVYGHNATLQSQKAVPTSIPGEDYQ